VPGAATENREALPPSEHASSDFGVAREARPMREASEAPSRESPSVRETVVNGESNAPREASAAARPYMVWSSPPDPGNEPERDS
jgi:hypothetical protein